MNYRKGFIRAYAVLATCWILLWLYVAISQLTRAFDNPLATQWMTQPKRAELAEWVEETRKKGYGDTGILESIATNRSDLAPKIAESRKWGYSATQVLDYLAGDRHNARRNYDEVGSTAEIALFPVAIGYLFLFIILPWIGRGFRNRTLSS